MTHLALTIDFAEDSTKQKQWQGFIKKNKLAIDAPLIDIITQLKKIIMQECEFSQIWQPIASKTSTLSICFFGVQSFSFVLSDKAKAL
ncbi:hypothetical protein PN36_28295, partial [Candidatus Thiomargarita nelsonii]